MLQIWLNFQLFPVDNRSTLVGVIYYIGGRYRILIHESFMSYNFSDYPVSSVFYVKGNFVEYLDEL